MLKFANTKEAMQHLANLTGKKIKIAAEVSEKELAQFLVDNPNPNDDTFHAFAEEKGADVHKLEAQAYVLATKYAEMLINKTASKKVANDNDLLGEALELLNDNPEKINNKHVSRELQKKIIEYFDSADYYVVNILSYLKNPIPEVTEKLEEIRKDNEDDERMDKENYDAHMIHQRSLEGW
jgi:hypothetical protein